MGLDCELNRNCFPYDCQFTLEAFLLTIIICFTCPSNKGLFIFCDKLWLINLAERDGTLELSSSCRFGTQWKKRG